MWSEVAAGTVGPATLNVPVRLRYQACDDNLCFRAGDGRASQWTLNVVAARQRRVGRGCSAMSSVGIAFGHGEAPAA